jgi:hypothetical protein
VNKARLFLNIAKWLRGKKLTDCAYFIFGLIECLV